MRIINDLDEMTETARGWLSGGPVGFVPTKGDLHEGQLTLVRAAHQECDITVVSIFANPLEEPTGLQTVRGQRPAGGYQSASIPSNADSDGDDSSSSEARQGQGEQAAVGPMQRRVRRRTVRGENLERDIQLLDAEGVDIVFIPGVQDFYPLSYSTVVTFFLPGTGPQEQMGERLNVQRLEKIAGSGYVQGFATGMTKLIQLVRPDIAFFSQKDAVRVAVVRRLVNDLNIDMRLRILPTVRENDGLAMSSKNAQLSPLERQAAQMLYHALLEGKACIEIGEQSPVSVEKVMADVLAQEPLVKVEYLTVCSPDTFADVEKVAPGTVLLVSAYVGATYLIDNVLWRKDGQWLT